MNQGFPLCRGQDRNLNRLQSPQYSAPVQSSRTSQTDDTDDHTVFMTAVMKSTVNTNLVLCQRQ